MTAPLNAAALEFVTVRHLATLTTLLPDGFPHVVPVGFTFEPTAAVAPAPGAEAAASIGTVRIITNGPSQKVLNVRRDGRASVCQVDGARWITLAGTARILDEPDAVADAVERYAGRYRQPRENPQRVVIAIDVERVMQSGLLSE
ncbi:PPOX class F420-dependent oxidoreductase [Herbiconiux flava]|uniref:PPOX class probable F420-dependent enzyme n=1 Tax=Herbiconiux flava TaxID=881268 RepID=A0A852SJD1_9MICO|nr:PPOX class F420-dependent oxidoreductase [Herbiconiux flava]NYD69423.1 PPOX class probable F420-dependent enzyme [Herbiconiux flava]GLK16168.1 PPOX class F420-dependent enzyme [Herbiconiux flava]